MNIEELLQKLDLRENLELEFKAAAAGLPSSLWATVSAFANTHGGWLLLGVREDKGKLNVDGVKNAAAMKQDIINLMRNRQKISLEVCGPEDVGIKKTNGADIVTLKIRAVSNSEKPVYIDGNPYTGAFVRRNEGDYRCKKEEVDRMIRGAGVQSADSSVLKGLTSDDLDKQTLSRYRQRFRQFNSAHQWNEYEDIRFLRALGGYRKDPHTGEEGFTRAAVLMFGSQEALFSIRPRHLIDFRLRAAGAAGEEARWEDRIAWEGNLYDAFFRIYPRLTESLKTPFRLEGPHRLDQTPAHEALREALVNMLVHADYAEPGALLIKASPGEFVFRNPGFSRVSEDDLLTGDRSDPRNPVLLRMFRHISLADEAGTGFPRILSIWRKAGLQLPSIVNDSERYEFTLSLRLVHLLSSQDRQWLAACAGLPVPAATPVLPGMVLQPLTQHEQITLIQARNNEWVNNASVQALTGLHRADVTELLTGLKNRGLLAQESAKRWAIYRLSEMVLDIFQEKPVIKTDTQKPIHKTDKEKPIKKTYQEKPIKKTDQIRLAILEFCRVPRSAREISKKINKNSVYLVAKYITPLVKNEKLAYTDPAHTKSRNQKYVAKPQENTQ
ncbi:MAG: transcriptional regulator [Elusimicrobia bacterium]|nr:MAG: transcriptional regulator [Elusimicrobiota bacterium]KAF0158015.1 MAG: transcriptional regulator [Elusimicrobiota bacterium]